jgi:16S rRNA (guanine1516-N2)-methyltransferase
MESQPPQASQVLLGIETDRLQLHWGQEPHSKPLTVELTALDTRSPFGRTRRQPLAKAIGLGAAGSPGPLHVVDATAGFGEDTWLLASFGCTVTSVERHPLVALILADALRRALASNPPAAAHVRAVCGDARLVLPTLQPQPDVVYLDPMFPPSKTTALKRKAVRILRAVVGDDADAPELFEVAARTARRRVVVKRPLHAPPLAGPPTITYPGKLLRYDVYVVRSTK